MRSCGVSRGTEGGGWEGKGELRGWSEFLPRRTSNSPLHSFLWGKCNLFTGKGMIPCLTKSQTYKNKVPNSSKLVWDVGWGEGGRADKTPWLWSSPILAFSPVEGKTTNTSLQPVQCKWFGNSSSNFSRSPCEVVAYPFHNWGNWGPARY